MIGGLRKGLRLIKGESSSEICGATADSRADEAAGRGTTDIDRPTDRESVEGGMIGALRTGLRLNMGESSSLIDLRWYATVKCTKAHSKVQP